jgi:hypothetical protein
MEMACKEMSAEDRRAAPARIDRLFAAVVQSDLKGLPVARLAPRLPRILADSAFRGALARHLAV